MYECVAKLNPENCTNCSSKYAYDCTTSVHNITLNSILVFHLTSRQTSRFAWPSIV